jgi:anti-sigma factor RsiW
MSLDPSENRPAMDCSELSRSAEALLDGEFDERERAEAAAHLAACPACRLLVEERERVRTAVREKLRAALGPGSPHGRAPEGLRQRLEAALDRERQPLWRRALAPLPLSAAAACAAGALLVLYTHSGADPLAEEAASKHGRGLPLEVAAASLGPEAVAGWFRGKVDFAARPPALRDARLVGARISHIRDRPAAYVRYELPRGQAGLFILEDPDRRFGSAGREVRLGPGTVRMLNAHGYNVVVWRSEGIVYSLVADLEERELEQLVAPAVGGR